MGTFVRRITTLAGQFKESEQTALLGLAVATGVISGLLAVGYYYLVRFLRWLFAGEGSAALSFVQNNVHLLIIPVVGGLLIGLLNYFFTSDARSSYGIPGVIEAVGLRGGKIRPKVVLARSLGAAICIGCGGAAGKQGSIAQMGLEIGSMLGQWLKLPEQKVKLLIMCGVAGMIGANYNTPLAGAVLVFEVILGEFNLNYFSLVVASSATAAVIYRGFLGNAAKFTAPAYLFQSPDEIVWYLLLGVLCGLLGVLYVKVVFRSEELFRGIRKYFPGRAQILVPVLGGLLMGVVNFSFPLAFGRGTQGIDLSLAEQLLPSVMLLLIALKLINISLTMGAWSTGGGFRAGLFTGAMLGGSAGAVFARLAPGFTSPAGTYALVGIGGVFAGFSQAPLTAIIMTSEMTKDFHLIIPLAITCVISAYTSRALTSETLYTGKLIQRGLDVFNARRSDILKNILVQDAMVATVETLPAGMPVRRAYKRASLKNFEGFPVIDHKGALVGLVTLENLQKAVQEGQSRARVRDVAVGPPVTVTAKDTLQDAARKIDRLRIKCLPVVQEDNPVALVGILTRDDIIRAYNRDLERVANHSPVIRKKKHLRLKPAQPAVLPHMALAATEVGLRYYSRPAAVTGEKPDKEKTDALPRVSGAGGQPAKATGEGGEKMPVEPEKKRFHLLQRLAHPEQASPARKDWAELDNATILAAPEISLIYYYAGKKEELSGGLRVRRDEREATGGKVLPPATGRRITLSGKVFS